METMNAEIKSVKTVLSSSLAIPNYQRPYRWTENNVRQLLEDVSASWKNGKNSYRIGSAIFNEANQVSNVVDGQQRITTILLVLKCLNSKIGNELRSSLQYKHVDSKNAIIRNAVFIRKWLVENIGDAGGDFEKYLLDHCEFVEIRVLDLSEAFQMFDSQNGRGKELEAYNLLKAFHIRAMETNSFDEKVDCDRSWEANTRYQTGQNNTQIADLLGQVINEQLYRTRLWSRKEKAWEFSKKELKEFKGISISKTSKTDFPYQNRELLLSVAQQYFDTMGVSINGLKSRFRKSNLENINPFSLINQNIINGKNFFDYTKTYVEIYKRLFYQEFEELLWFKEFTHKYCHYSGSQRDGDKYLFELFKSLTMLVFDKFGEEGLERYYKILYLVVYRQRLMKEQVKYASVAQYPLKENIFQVIEVAQSFSELTQIEKMAFKDVECKKDVEIIVRFFISQNIRLKSDDAKKFDLAKYNLN